MSQSAALVPPHELQSAMRLPEARAADEIRTRDPELGKLVLYQLSYRRTPRGYYALRPESPTGGTRRAVHPARAAHSRPGAGRTYPRAGP